MAYTSGKAPALIAISCFAAIVLLFFGWLTGGAYAETFPHPFDAARWKTANTGQATRCGMILDLQYRIGIVGRTRSDLSRQLGAPVDNAHDPSTSSWPLCPSFMDVWVLEVRWRDGRAASAAVHDT